MCHGPATRAMLNHDILYVIFEQLAAPDRSWYKYEGVTVPGRVQERGEAIRRATLASCVRVCRAFFEPAACVLWRDLVDLGAIPACDEGVSCDATVSVSPEISYSLRYSRCGLDDRISLLAHR